jgi:hypothetical protein
MSGTGSQCSTERALRSRRNYWLKSWFRNDAGEGEEDTPTTRDPDTAHGAEGLQISRVKFEDLTTHFPDVTLSTEAVLRSEVREVRAQLDGASAPVLLSRDALTMPCRGVAPPGRDVRREEVQQVEEEEEERFLRRQLFRMTTGQMDA